MIFICHSYSWFWVSQAPLSSFQPSAGGVSRCLFVAASGKGRVISTAAALRLQEKCFPVKLIKNNSIESGNSIKITHMHGWMCCAKLNLKIDIVPGFLFCYCFLMKSSELLGIDIDCCRWWELLFSANTAAQKWLFVFLSEFIEASSAWAGSASTLEHERWCFKIVPNFSAIFLFNKHSLGCFSFLKNVPDFVFQHLHK